VTQAAIQPEAYSRRLEGRRQSTQLGLDKAFDRPGCGALEVVEPGVVALIDRAQLIPGAMCGVSSY
jgi:hypothetical protein